MSKRRRRRKQNLIVALANEYEREIRNVLICVLGVIALIIIFNVASKPVEKTFEVPFYQKYRICYNEVNVREKPSLDAEITHVLTLGDYVELAGKSIQYPLMDKASLWYQLTDGTWIVSDAIMESNEFHFRFGH